MHLNMPAAILLLLLTTNQGRSPHNILVMPSIFWARSARSHIEHLQRLITCEKANKL